jgi:hypothetical protein
MRYLFLNKHSNGTKHSEAAVLKFFGNHHIESFVGLGLQAKRIESDVSGKIAVEEARAECTVRVIVRLSQRLENTEKNNEKQIASEISPVVWH